MPKSLKKSCTGVQTSISKYFGGSSGKSGSHSNTKSGNNHNQKPAEQHHQFSRGKKKHVSSGSDDGFGLPGKRAKRSHNGHQVEDVDCEDVSDQSVKEETKTPSRRVAAGLSSYTMARLKGFACLTEPHAMIEGEVKGPGDTTGASCDPGKTTTPPCDVSEKCHNNDRLQKNVKACEKQGFSMTKFVKPGGGMSAERSSPSDQPCKRSTKTVYTPLEQQFIQIKEQHGDALLAVECGYKYRFFGEDAEIAAKDLNIFCHLDHNFMTCSIPTHRLFVHVRRLVSHGHKVGVVKQTETSAIKASGANKNTLFTRQLSGLYTKSTLVGEDVNPVCRLGDTEEGACDDLVLDPSDSYLLCVSENWDKPGKQVTIGLVAVQPSTGDILMDCFTDGPSRSELEGRILKVNPVEILVPSDLSEHTHRLLHSITNASDQADDRVRIERRDSTQFEFVSAMNTITEFYCNTQDTGSRSLSSVVSLEMPVICCLGPLIQYLREFSLERVLLSDSSLRHLSSESKGMVLSATSLRNLEILTNQTDGGVKGSLLWVLDHTRTPFGKRLMRQWVSQPLTHPRSISDRQEAVCEILESDSATLTSVKSLLSHLPDLERGICSIYHKKCSTQEFYLISSSLSRLGLELHALLPAIQSQLRSSLLRTLLLDSPELLAPAHSFLKVLNEKAAKSGDKKELFADLSGFPLLKERREQIQTVLSEIQDHRKDARITLRAPTLDYITVSGQEFLIEVKNSMSSVVPSNWVKISSTKTVSRYHSPFLVEHYRKLLQLREQLLLDCQKEWTNFLEY